MTRFRVLLLALCTTMAVLVPATPAEAGWSGGRCHAPADDVQVCAQVFTTKLAPGRFRVDTMRICAYHTTGPYDGFKNTYSGDFEYRGSSGANQGYGILYPDTNVGTCTDHRHDMIMGGQACYAAFGMANRVGPGIGDASWYISGSILGGPCTNGYLRAGRP